jgi:hypothetical protein
MKTCQYCQTIFQPRAQVKNPKACSSPSCQRKRQRDNERCWHDMQRGRYDSKYHKNKKKQRFQRITSFTRNFLAALRIGTSLLELRLDLSRIETEIVNLFSQLGIRAINKLWST